MISISGMRNDYIDNYSAQTLLQMARDGVRAEYMTPSFPVSANLLYRFNF
jgi:hypothetical protein